MTFTPPKKEKLTGILAITLYLVTGLLLLFRPDFMTEMTRWTLTIALGLAAVVKAVRYFTTEPSKAAEGYSLTVALIAGTLALLAWLNGGLLKNQLWGVLILCGGYMKLQTTWDFYRLGHSRWWWIMIGAAVSVLCGTLFVTGAITANLAIWVGIALLVEAALDTAVMIMTAKGDRWNAPPREKKPKAQPVEAPAEPAQPAEAPAEPAAAEPEPAPAEAAEAAAPEAAAE